MASVGPMEVDGGRAVGLVENQGPDGRVGAGGVQRQVDGRLVAHPGALGVEEVAVRVRQCPPVGSVERYANGEIRNVRKNAEQELQITARSYERGSIGTGRHWRTLENEYIRRLFVSFVRLQSHNKPKRSVGANSLIVVSSCGIPNLLLRCPETKWYIFQSQGTLNTRCSH